MALQQDAGSSRARAVLGRARQRPGWRHDGSDGLGEVTVLPGAGGPAQLPLPAQLADSQILQRSGRDAR